MTKIELLKEFLWEQDKRLPSRIFLVSVVMSSRMPCNLHSSVDP